MYSHFRTLVMWGPRLLGLSVAAFLGLFALDAFDTGPVAAALPSLAVHLVPALVVGLMAAAGWRYPWLGAIGFGVLAAGYAVAVPHRLDWVLVISGPLAVVAVLFALDAMSARAHGQNLT
jgi:hypothetical protein